MPVDSNHFKNNSNYIGKVMASFMLLLEIDVILTLFSPALLLELLVLLLTILCVHHGLVLLARLCLGFLFVFLLFDPDFGS